MSVRFRTRAVRKDARASSPERAVRSRDATETVRAEEITARAAIRATEIIIVRAATRVTETTAMVRVAIRATATTVMVRVVSRAIVTTAAARVVSRATVITAAVRADVPARETAQSLSIPH